MIALRQTDRMPAFPMPGEIPLKKAYAHHLGLDADSIEHSLIALLPGDPGRVPVIAESFKGSKEINFQREFRTHVGYLGDCPVLVASTGCGGPSLSVCVEELAQIGVRNFIRVGSCGAIQEKINIADCVISSAAVRLDGASRSFAPIEYPAVADLDLTSALVESAKAQGLPYHVGITASTDTFYQGQERYDTFSGHVPAHLRGSMADWRAMKVANFEMETATLFTMCSTMGLRAASVCGVVATRTKSEALASTELFRKAERNAIEMTVGAVARLVAGGLLVAG